MRSRRVWKGIESKRREITPVTHNHLRSKVISQGHDLFKKRTVYLKSGPCSYRTAPVQDARQ